MITNIININEIQVPARSLTSGDKTNNIKIWDVTDRSGKRLCDHEFSMSIIGWAQQYKEKRVGPIHKIDMERTRGHGRFP